MVSDKSIAEWYGRSGEMSIFSYNQYMESQSDLETLRGKLVRLYPLVKERYKVTSLGIFGSYRRNEQRSGSDLDLLVTFSDPPSLLKFIQMENYLSDELAIKVDLVMQDSLKPSIGKRILSEVELL
jgi:hypothetical protein